MVRLEEGRYVLVSGECRLLAIRDYLWPTAGVLRHGAESFPEGIVPVSDFGELDELAAEEAECDENLRRRDPTWQEKAETSARLLRLRQRQAALVNAASPSVAAIALEVRGSADGSNQAATRREIIVAEHLADPEVAGAKTLDEAFKTLKRKEETQRRVALAGEVGRTYSSDVHRALHGSFAEQKFDSLFDVILTDPPYGMGADQFGDSGGLAVGAHDYDDSYESWLPLMYKFARFSFEITKPAAHLYAFCDIERFPELKNILAEEGWNVFRTPLIWHKPSGNRLPWVDFGPQRKYEVILYANKGRRPVTHIFPDLVSYPSDDNLGHPAQKPVALYVDLLKRSVAPGDAVLDPFAGSGPIFPAAHELKCRATGIEMAAHHYALCLKRLDLLKQQQELGL